MCNYAHYSLFDALAAFAIKLSEKESEKLLTTRALVNDTRKLKTNDIFCAIIGEHQDGREYIDQAIKLGATVILAECTKAEQHGHFNYGRVGNKNAIVIQFYQLNFHLFALCQYYYQHPQQNITMIGVTGTNGKTSTCQIIAKLLQATQQSCSVLGTLGAGNVDALAPLANTTPGATELHHYLNEFKAKGIKNLAMEVSSHALSQRRLTNDIIDIAVFTNLSRDHLDYHQTMAAYSAAKKTIFSGTSEQIAVLNIDDNQAQQWLTHWPQNQPYLVYARSEISQAKQHLYYLVAENISHDQQGVSFDLVTHLGSKKINSPLLGDFNIDNLLAAIAVVIAKSTNENSEFNLDKLSAAIGQLTSVTGRMEAFSDESQQARKPTAVVDYAHTPEALKNALRACREHCQQSLWVVFGCGGDRDKGKRSLMGKVAENGADYIIVTNDNPRSEAPELIAKDILAGCKYPEKITVMLDRKQAVLAALTKAKAGDLVLLAGKGHEDHIIIGDQKIAYNERAVVKNFYQQHHKILGNAPNIEENS